MTRTRTSTPARLANWAFGSTLAALVAGLLLAAPSAHARLFGANLNRPANSPATCQSFIFFQAVPSCSWFTSGALFNTTEGMVVPDAGVLTFVRVKVGPQTGPMRISTLTSLRRENSGEAACCIGRRQSGVFVPTPNAITTVVVNLPVVSTFNSVSRIFEFDSMAITMENSATPVPAHFSNTDGDNCSGGWFPAVRPGQENFTGPYGQCSYTVLIQGDWQPPGAVRVGGTGAQVADGGASIPLACLRNARCAGVLRLLQNLQAGKLASAQKKKKPATYGSASFSIAAKKKGKIKVKLSKRARELVRDRGELVVSVVATIGGKSVTGAMMLRRGK